MSKDWRNTVTDPAESKVFVALEDPAWDFRTLNGLVKSTGLEMSQIKHVIGKYGNLIRESPIPDKSDRRLYTLASRSLGSREMFNMIRAAVTKSST